MRRYQESLLRAVRRGGRLTAHVPKSQWTEICLAVVLFSFVAGSAAGSVPLWGNLKSGPHGVGFTTMELYDYSRTFQSSRDYFGNSVLGETARPIQVCVWYPSGPSDATALMLSDYALPYPEDGRFYEFLSQLQSREALLVGAITGTEGGQIVELLNLHVESRRSAPPLDGPFPVILYCPNRGRGIIENSVMCEYLASHGYVVDTFGGNRFRQCGGQPGLS